MEPELSLGFERRNSHRRVLYEAASLDANPPVPDSYRELKSAGVRPSARAEPGGDGRPCAHRQCHFPPEGGDRLRTKVAHR
jgi:hypothetical protein